MRGERGLVLVIVARSVAQAVSAAVGAALLHAVASGRDPLPLLATATGMFGVALVLVAILRERGTVTQSASLAVAVVIASAAWGLLLPARSPDALAVLTRAIGFGILGEAYLWRLLGIARGLQRWREVRDDALFALGAIVICALAPAALDRGALPALALVVAITGAIGLSLARSIEELALAAGKVRGRAMRGAATGTAFLVGVLAIATAAALPWAQEVLGRAARTMGPVLADLLFVVLLPIGYLAAYLVYLLQWIRELLRPTAFDLVPPRLPFDAEADAERLREMEATRPFLVGALEVMVALVAILVGIVLVARLVQERRALRPEGVTLERESVDGNGLAATLRSLFPRRAARARPLRDDGSAAAKLRLIYWKLLDLAEREGPGRRAPAETPAEHEQRLVATARRWTEAGTIVRAFERLRYGEIDPDSATLADAATALRALEGAPAPSA